MPFGWHSSGPEMAPGEAGDWANRTEEEKEDVTGRLREFEGFVRV